MDPTNRLLAWAAYVTGAVLIGSGAYFTYHLYRQNNESARLLRIDAAEGVVSQSAATANPSADVQGASIEQLYLQRAQIRRLQALLEQKTRLVEQRTALLEQRNNEQAALRAELDGAIELLGALTAELAAAPLPADGPSNGAKLRSELERLRAEAAKNRELAAQQRAELERLRDEMGTTDQDIAQLQIQAVQEFESLTADHREFEAVVSETLGRIGAEAVPALVYQLASPRPEVRQWAARALGELGPLAKDAIPPLQDELKDQVPEVAEAARVALEKVAPTNN